ncbi:AAA family ATPase [Myxococcota bacterium]|nr:AAA family ATPase [Myxococcota bacterium]
MLTFPPFRLDVDDGRLWRGEAPVALRRKPLEILCYLARHPKKLVTHDELLAEVWRGVVVSDSAMRSHLHELRQVLGDGVIETVIGRGYRFVAPLHEALPAPEVRVDALVVGRDAELTTLRELFTRARAGRRQLAFVTGEPGIGKSTLVRTFVASLDPRAVIVASGACLEQHGTPEPYLAIIEALGGLVRSERGAELRTALVRHAPTFVAQLPSLVRDDQLAEVTRRAAFGNESRQLRELCEALEVISAERPLVLVLEDLQWSDVATIDLVSLLGQRPQPAKLFVIATSRHADVMSPDHPLNRVMRSLVTRSGATALPLAKIDVAAVEAFVDRRFPGHTLPRALTELVAKITGGTPLYVVSLLDELVGRGMITARDGAFALTVSIDDVQAHRPASVKQLIDIQLDRLAPAEQRVLEAASVVGAEVSTALVAAALELPVEDVDDTCAGLARRALFLRTEPGERYGFTHALVQEVCVERASPARRQRWHRLVAEVIERDPRAAELASALAKHFDAAGDAARAIPAYLAAARQAALRYASSDAVVLCARALELVARLPAGRARDEQELEILGAMCRQVNSSSYSAAFAGRDPVALYTRAIDLARALGDPTKLYAAITRRCTYEMIVAGYGRTAALTAELEQLEAAHALDPAQLHDGIFARAYIAFYLGELERARGLFERLAPAGPSPFGEHPAGRALVLGHLACVRWALGDGEGALDDAHAALALATAAGSPILQALAHVVLARLRYLRRDPLPLVEETALDAVRAAALDFGLSTEASAFALWAQAARGPLALDAITPLFDDLRARMTTVSTGSTLVGLVAIDVLRTSGHTTEARALTDAILTFAERHDERVYLPALLCVRGAQREETEPEAARSDYVEARAHARAMGVKSLERRAEEHLAALEART